MVGTQAVADVPLATLELDVLIDKGLVHLVVGNDVVADVVQDREVGLRLEDHAVVGQLKRAMFEGRQHVHFTAGAGEATVGDAGPQDRVHLGHVRTPQHEGIGILDVVIAPHRLVHAKGAHEPGDCGGHAVAGVGVDIVGAEPRLVELGGGVAFPNRPLPGAEHRQCIRPIGLDRRLPLGRHQVERLIPADRCEFTVLVVLAILHPQQGLGEAVTAIHDLGQEIALDAVQATIDRRIRIALGRDHAPVLHPDQHRAAHTAETAGGLVPTHPVGARTLGQRCARHRNAGRGGRGCHSVCLDKFASVHVFHASCGSRPSSVYS